MRGLTTIALLAGVAWAAWFIAFYASHQTSGGVPPPPGISVVQPG